MNKLNTIQRFRKQIRDKGVDEPMKDFYARVEQFILQEQNRLLDEVLKIVGEDEETQFYQGEQEPLVDEEAVIRNKLRHSLRSSIEELKENL